MATTIRHTNSPGTLVLVLMLLQYRPIRWLVYAAMAAGAVAWMWDSGTETKLAPSQYEFTMVDNPSVQPSTSAVFKDIRFVNRSDYTVQRIDVAFRLYDCPSTTSPVSNCSKLRLDKQSYRKEVAAGEGADFTFNTAISSSTAGSLRVVPVIRDVIADKDAVDDGFVG